MPDRRRHSGIFTGGYSPDPLPDLLGIHLVYMLDMKHFTTQTTHTGKTVNPISITKGFHGLTEQYQRFLDRRTHPAFGRVGHIDKKENGYIPFIPFQADKQPVRRWQTGPGVGQGFYQGVKINIITIALSFQEPLLITHHLKLMPQMNNPAMVPGKGEGDKIGTYHYNFLLGKHTPVFTKTVSTVIPFVITLRMHNSLFIRVRSTA